MFKMQAINMVAIDGRLMLTDVPLNRVGATLQHLTADEFKT